ncbi:Protein phosphatase 1 regulatory subunit 7 [Nosema granulosis]|uniref:Protein phosphatase 1 regulatory subunit 7 n=1 Tax=Nosema granulosis TaxID=83296 RepID=A0A9P6H3E8_9MICR|nr:Protein phosphatase 1 regulatory subunit 7 [Nosema granulosis]
MKEVILVHQKLSEIPRIDSDVTHVDLRRNDIKEIKFGRNTNLQYLDLSDNRIRKMESFENLPNLRILDMSYNLFENISLPPLKLKELYLICNDIYKIESLDLGDLEKLDLAVNNIEIIENLESCRGLKELYLGSNNIKEMGDLSFLTNLSILDLQNNKLEEIDCSLLPKSLTTLLVSDNRNLKNIKNLDDLENLKLLAIERTSVVNIVGDCVKFEIWK